VATCSPKNFKLVESYGAEKAFDYNSPTCGEEIRNYTKNTLQYVLDIITEARTLRHCYTAIGRGGGRYIGFELIPEDLIAGMRKTVKADWVLGIEMSGGEIALPGGYYRKPNPELRAWCCEWFKRCEALIHAGKLRSHPVKLNEGGLEAVISGVGQMKRREISGEKLVYLVQAKDPNGVSTSTTPKIQAGTNGVTPIKMPKPTTQKRLMVLGQNQIGLDDRGPVPQIREDEVLVRVIYAAVNPVDAKSVDLSPARGATPGCDFSGEVVTVGGAVKKTLAAGDRVCGLVFGDNPDEPDSGTFAEYVAVQGDLVFKIPQGMSYQTAATLGIGMGTAGMALYHILNLQLPRFPAPEPRQQPAYALVYGGGTATGKLAIQLLRM
jgi:NADPH:quinone reductase-like Zn-dependent oxidoreductase